MNIKLRNLNKNFCFIIDLQKKTFTTENSSIHIKNISYPANVIYYDDIFKALLNIGKFKPKTIVVNIDTNSIHGARVIDLLKKYSKEDNYELFITDSCDDFFVFIS